MNVEYFLERYGWDGKFFFLTRDHNVEITTMGGGYGDVPIHEKGCLFFYANQVMYQKPSSEIDNFGRNYLDQLFIDLCAGIHVFVYCSEPRKVFKSLTTRKEGDRYLVRLQYDDMEMEMEVEEMYHYFKELAETRKTELRSKLSAEITK